MKHVGFTGTRFGMSLEQTAVVKLLVEQLDGVKPRDLHFAHHGDCVGADADFHALVSERGWATVGHLPVDEMHRAFCSFVETRAPLPHMKRNRAIVAESDIMIAAPLEMVEQERGGTWKTIGFARKAKRPLAIVWRDGSVTRERWP